MSNKDKVREKIAELFCQHCKAMQKTNNTVVDCWYNPLDEDYKRAFCASSDDTVDAILSISELAILAEDQSLPEIRCPEDGISLQPNFCEVCCHLKERVDEKEADIGC